MTCWPPELRRMILEERRWLMHGDSFRKIRRRLQRNLMTKHNEQEYVTSLRDEQDSEEPAIRHYAYRQVGMHMRWRLAHVHYDFEQEDCLEPFTAAIETHVEFPNTAALTVTHFAGLPWTSSAHADVDVPPTEHTHQCVGISGGGDIKCIKFYGWRRHFEDDELTYPMRHTQAGRVAYLGEDDEEDAWKWLQRHHVPAGPCAY